MTCSNELDPNMDEMIVTNWGMYAMAGLNVGVLTHISWLLLCKNVVQVL